MSRPRRGRIRPAGAGAAIGAAGFAVLACAPPALAGPLGDADLGVSVGAASDYVFRGKSLTDEGPQVYGAVNAALGRAYAGVWVSNVDFGNGTDAEVDLYAGVTPQAGPVSFDIAIVYYGYAGQPKGSHQDYFEGKIAASVPLGPASLGAAVAYSPEYMGKRGKALYYEINAATTVPGTGFSISAAAGRQEFNGPFDYNTWNLGVGYALGDHLGFDLRYWDTDVKRDKLYGGRVTAGVKLTF